MIKLVNRNDNGFDEEVRSMNVSSSRGKWVGSPTTPSTYSEGARDDQQDPQACSGGNDDSCLTQAFFP